MTDSLVELLSSHLGPTASKAAETADNGVTTRYLSRLSSLSLDALSTLEAETLQQNTHTNNLALQSLSARSNASIVTSSTHLSNLSQILPTLGKAASGLRHDVPSLDRESVSFSEKYSRSTQNEVLDRRKAALLMARNVERLTDILDLPALLSSTVASSTFQGSFSTNSNASALDLHSHIKRLHLAYSSSAIIGSIYDQMEAAMQEMTSNLIASLRPQNIKLAAGLRSIGWLKRTAPELDGSGQNKEGCLGALFLICRLATLLSMLSALSPLRDLADQETSLRLRALKDGKLKSSKESWSHGQQTERFLKRYIEIFREQSFSIISMYKSIFPAQSDTPLNDDASMSSRSLKLQTNGATINTSDPLGPAPPAMATFPLHLLDLLTDTLRQYLPNIRDRTSRDSLLTQVLYCAGSLGRLGGDFSMLLASLGSNDDDGDETEWITIMQKHRQLASKLEKMASGETKAKA